MALISINPKKVLLAILYFSILIVFPSCTLVEENEANRDIFEDSWEFEVEEDFSSSEPGFNSLVVPHRRQGNPQDGEHEIGQDQADRHRPPHSRRGRSRIHQQLDRGLWMHYHSGDSYGTSTIVGNPSAEVLAIWRMTNWSIGRVYGGYRDLPVTNRFDLASWNQKLHQAGISSQLLLGVPHHIFPGVECREALLNQIEERLIDFHEGPPTVGPWSAIPLTSFQRFDGLHLDIEPQAFGPDYYASDPPPACAPISEYWSPATRAELFERLYDTLVDVRDFLDTNGYTNMPIYIDLPYWVDTSSSFDWGTTPDFTNGIDWIFSASQIVDGMTFMTYENDDPADIRIDIIGERMVLLDSIDVRPSLNAKERVGWSSIHTWTSFSQFFDVVEDLESGTGLYRYNVDIHNYRYLANPWPIVMKHEHGVSER